MSFIIDMSHIAVSARRGTRFPRRLVFLTLLPFLVVGGALIVMSFWQVHAERRARRDNALDQAATQILSQTRAWGETARVAAVASDLDPADPARCERYLSDVLARFPDMTVAEVTNAAGHRVAEVRRIGVLSGPGVSLEGEPLRRHVERVRFWVAPLHIQNESRPRLPFVVTIRHGDRTSGFLVAEFRTDPLATITARAPFPMTLTDDLPNGDARRLADLGLTLALVPSTTAVRNAVLMLGALLLLLGVLAAGIAFAEITWSRRAAEDIAHRERLVTIGATASAVGHEIRTALAVIRNAVNLLKNRADFSDPRTQKHVDAIESQVRLANRVLADLLEFARPKGYTLRLDHVNPIVRDVLSTLEIPNSIRVRTTLPNELPPVALDADKMKQAFTNLILNAIEAMPDGGMITVETRRVPEHVVLEVRDTGPGIDVELRERMFEPFFTTKPRGMGLGLAIVKKIVDAHYGDIVIDSEPGEGASVRLRFPVQTSQPDSILLPHSAAAVI